MTAQQQHQPKIVKQGGRYWIRRLNILLRFARVNLGDLDNGKFQRLLDDLHWALYDAKRDRRKTDYPFDNRIATREAVGETQRGLCRIIDADESTEIQDEDVTLLLDKQVLRLHGDATGYWSSRASRHFPTNVYEMFSHLLEASAVKPSDFRQCASEQCSLRFVPLRKSPESSPCYCSLKCANRIAARNYRKRLTEAKRRAERDRSKKRYEARGRQQYPKARIQTRPKRGK